MAKDSWGGWSYEELAREAQLGMVGQGAVVEASRRLAVSVQASSDSADKLATQMIALTAELKYLTWLLLFVGVLQLALVCVQWWKG